MRFPHALVIVGVLVVGVGLAAAQTVTLQFHEGKVKLSAQNVPVSRILAEWARAGKTTIVNGERVPGPAVSIELDDVPEQQALDIVLRGVSGYLVAGRETATTGTSSFDCIFILPTSSRPTTASSSLPPQQNPLFNRNEDADDDDDLPPTPRGIAPNPGSRLPREVASPQNPRPAVVPVEPAQEAEPENRPATPPANGNPFVTGAGSPRPGVVSPGPPATTRPRDN